ncbi:ComEC/Rec2 family competence protein [Phycisphaera mikurensis]|uniref:ComEC/Rec2 family competence protein n=1 Tax=Phycisphaera mikurensis TaxID=547188 RepID=UPI00059E86A6|nr:ComEC/Rec2 family competence protein [Phycisphaera mikurensis]MBB6442610.1 competence protein ComEC [Phycisphaera mikurensis]
MSRPSAPGDPSEASGDATAPTADGWAWRLAAPAAIGGVLVAHGLAQLRWVTAEAWRPAVLVVLAAAAAGLLATLAVRRFHADRVAAEPRTPAVRGTRGAAALPLLALLLGYAAWSSVAAERLARDDVARLVGPVAVPVVLEGRLVGTVKIKAADRGAFAAFNYRRPRTLGRLEVSGRFDAAAGGMIPARGTVLLKVNRPAPLLAEGQRVRVTGKLQAFTPAENPGSYDFAAAMERAGIAGRLTVRKATGVEVRLAEENLARDAALLRQALRTRAWNGLERGFESGSGPAALLGSLLLGRADVVLDDLREDFRVVGLSHLLSISGAHLGVLVLLMVGVCRGLPVHPRTATLAVLAAVAFYLLLVPVRVPVLRAALMAACFLGPSVFGRRLPAGRALTIAALAVLAWRPHDLFAPGFQLSFLAVWAIVRFAKPIAERLHPPPLVTDAATGRTPAGAVQRGFFEIIGVSLAAAAATAPLVLHHFGIFSPLAVPGSVLSWPLFGFVLGLGHLKLAIGMLWPEASSLLAGPLSVALAFSASLVRLAASLPGVAWVPARPVPLLWTLAALLFVIALLHGVGSGRPRPRLLVAAALLLAGSLAVTQGVQERFDSPPDLRLTMLAVGDGSAWLVESGGGTLMFDCGSSTIAQVGEREVAPALRALGVRRIDTLVISHADLDHFSGVLELADALPIGRVLCSPEVTNEARDLPAGAAAVLLDGLAARRIPLGEVTAGGTWRIGTIGAACRVLWPPPGLTLADARNSNDHSIVLRVELPAEMQTERPARSILLSGDIQQHAITALLAAGAPLRSTLADLPHHGSVVRASPDWLAAADPAILLQSTGRRRLERDKWRAILEENPRVRLASAAVGMVQITLESDGSLAWSTHRGGSGRMTLEEEERLPLRPAERSPSKGHK